MRRLGERRRLREALRLIARGGCENYTGDRRCWDSGARVRGGRYLAEAWCHPCIAQAALDRRGER